MSASFSNEQRPSASVTTMHSALGEYTSRYTVIKNSWKGKYMRIFCVGRKRISTIDPQHIFNVTNTWDYSTQIVDVAAAPQSLTEFTVTIGRTGKTETVSFQCGLAVERAELLTEVQRNRALFDPRYQRHTSIHVFAAQKYCFDEEYRDCQLRVTNISLEQLDSAGNVMGEYLFMHIKGLTFIQDNPKSLVVFYGPQLKMHMYTTGNPRNIADLIVQFAKKYVGLPPFREVQKLSQQQFDNDRLGVDRNKSAPVAKFPVMKYSPKHCDGPVQRIFATTEECVLELDPRTYNAVSAFFFSDIHALIRCGDEQRFIIQYRMPAIKKVYTSTMRDALLAHLLDCCRTAQNLSVCVLMNMFDRGKRSTPLSVVAPEEVESSLLNCLIDPLKGGGHGALSFVEVVEFFNTNIEYSGLRFTENRDGLFAENRQKMIFSALVALLNNFPSTTNPLIVVQGFYALRRLCVTRIGFSSAAIVPSLIQGIEFVCTRALKINNISVSHAVIDFLNVLMTPHHDHYEIVHEQANKNRILGHEEFVDSLLYTLRHYTAADSASLVVQALLDFFVYALCPPFSETTEATLFNSVMKRMVDTTGRELFALLQHTCSAIRYSAGQLIRVIMEEGTNDHFFAMQLMSLSEGSFLGQFHIAAFSKNREQRDLSRQLIAYWTHENTDAQELLRAMLPSALLHYLQSKNDPPEDELEKERRKSVVAMSSTLAGSKTGWFKKRFHPSEVLPRNTGNNASVTLTEAAPPLRYRDVRVKTTLNWSMLFYQLKQDHMRADLIWNHTTRNELLEALESEMQAFNSGMELRHEAAVSWNYREFEVRYPSLKDELKIGQHYPRLLFEIKNPVIARPGEFFNDMYHRFLLSHDHKMKLDCLHGMSILYEHYAEVIGKFGDMEYLVRMLETTFDPLFRDRLLIFISHLLRNRQNVKLFLDCNGFKPLVDLLPVAHLHVDRPQVYNVTNAIECAGKPVDLQDQAHEWYYTKEGVKQDPVSYFRLKQLYEEGEVTNSTKVWAQGMTSWRQFEDVPQLRWGTIASKSNKLLTLSEVSCIILDTFSLLCAYYPSRDSNGAIMQPVPRVKRYLSSPDVLPHIVQLLLTFDPALCTRVHSLLYIIMEDNLLISRFFLTGVFFFALMYTGSDVLPLCRLLHLSHHRQAFQSCHDNEIIRHSILTAMLPPALVCFLSTHGPERFANIWLGEYETPEAIWGKEMRRYLVEKIASHIADFTPRLLGNNLAVYQYCPIVGVVYNALQHELFCSHYYLRHFCDELHYPNWPVADPIALLREVLVAWRRELDKKPSRLSRESCMEDLQITNRANELTPQLIRKAYFKLAAQYHPDKNPDGREMFERIQVAYEFLASDAVLSDEPNPRNIALLLQTQSILFRRFGETLSHYKYAGYDLLLKLIQLEYEDSQMLQNEVVLMVPATELCYFTVRNVPLNADELQEAGGIELLSRVTQRCFEAITPGSTDELDQVKIARYCMHTFEVAAQFPDCRRHIVNEPVICHLVSKGIAYEKAVGLSRACIQACRALCIDNALQERMVKAGAIWHLLIFLFRYDYTLGENGLELQEEHHTQVFENRAAVFALQAIYALAGIQPSTAYIQTNLNTEIVSLLQKLLTPYVVHKMRSTPNGEEDILKLINSNHETPYLLWNNSTRRELLDLLSVNSEKCRDAGMCSDELPSLEDNKFVYSLHTKELIVGGMFVRLYNEQPTFTIEDPVNFLGAMVKFLQYQLTHDNSAGVAMTLEAMRNLLIAYVTRDVSTTLLPSLTVLLTVLSYDDTAIVIRAAQLLETVALQRNCVEAIGKVSTAVAEVILAIDRGGEAVEPSCLGFLRVALTDRGVVQQSLDRGLYAILLRIFGTTSMQDCKDDVCACMAKSFTDKLCGSKLFLRASKLLPYVILEMMKENPTSACQLLDTWQETPELVWSKECRAQFVENCTACQADIVELLQRDRTSYWKIPENIAREKPEDMHLGGVYLQLYLNQPGWTVRKPKEFLTALLERFMVECGKSGDEQDTVTTTLIAEASLRLLRTTPSLGDYIFSLGYAKKLFMLLESKEEVVADNALKLVHEECSSRVCVENLVGFDPVASLLAYLRAHVSKLPLLMDTMVRLVSHSSEGANMIRLALQNQLPTHLLQLLEDGLTPEVCGDQPAAAVRALIIKVIKAMVAVQDPVYGPQLDHILAQSRVWGKYKLFSHDLFLSNTRFDGYLEGSPQQQQQLSLTAAPVSYAGNGDEPPPL